MFNRKILTGIGIVAVFLLSGIAMAGIGVGGLGGGSPKFNLTISTQVINSYGGTLTAGNFTINVQASNGTQVATFVGSNHTVVSLVPGTYYVSESPVSGYSEAIGGNCAVNGSITITANAATCTVTNRDIASHLNVIENVVGGPYSSSNFGIQVAGTSPTPSSFQGSSSGTLVTIGAGNYSVNAAEVRFSNFTYYLQSYSNGCVGAIGLGQNATCTITSTFTVPSALSVTLMSNTDHVELGESIAFTANITGGLAPYTYVISVKNTTSNGSFVPTGQNGTISSSGNFNFSETPPKLGADFYTITITDSLNQTASATLHVVASAQNNGKGSGGP